LSSNVCFEVSARTTSQLAVSLDAEICYRSALPKYLNMHLSAESRYILGRQISSADRGPGGREHFRATVAATGVKKMP